MNSTNRNANFSVSLDDIPKIMLQTYYDGPDANVFKTSYTKFIHGLVHDAIDLQSDAYKQLSDLFKWVFFSEAL